MAGAVLSLRGSEGPGPSLICGGAVSCPPPFSFPSGSRLGEKVATVGLALSPLLAFKHPRKDLCLHPFILALWNPLECLETSGALVVSLAKICSSSGRVQGWGHVFTNTRPLLHPGMPPSLTPHPTVLGDGPRAEGVGLAPCEWPACCSCPPFLSLLTRQRREGREPLFLVWCACVLLSPLASSPAPPRGLGLGRFLAGTWFLQHPGLSPQSPPGFSEWLSLEEQSREELSGEQTAPPHAAAPPTFLSVWPFPASPAGQGVWRACGWICVLVLGVCVC